MLADIDPILWPYVLPKVACFLTSLSWLPVYKAGPEYLCRKQ